MGNIIGIGRGKKAAGLALQGFNYAKENPLLRAAQGAGVGAIGATADALGLNGAPAQTQGFQKFLDSLGYQTQLRAGADTINASAAARGELGSGATLKALQGYGQNLAQQGYGQYLGLLQQLAGQGQQAALGTAAAGTSGGSAAASAQPQNTGVLGRFFGI